MKVLLVTPTLQIGGADLFCLRLAEALSMAHEVTIFVMHRRYVDTTLAAHLHLHKIPLVSMPWTSLTWGKLTYRLSRWIAKFHPGLDFLSHLCSLTLKKLQRHEMFDVVNAHSMDAELVAAHAFLHTTVPIVATDHGEYLIPACRKRVTLPGIPALFLRSNRVILPSEANLTASIFFPRNKDCKTHIVPYGFSPRLTEQVQRPSGARIVFGIAARGIREKGWFEAMAAFVEAAPRIPVDVHLVLVGELPFKEELVSICPPEILSRVHFCGGTSDAMPWIAGFDCGLLPSFYQGETLPVFIIECLSYGCPVIATPQGGIPAMLAKNDSMAGALVPKGEGGRASIPHLVEEMVRFACNEAIRTEWCNSARLVFDKFSMSECVSSYESIFEDSVKEAKQTAPSISVSDAPESPA